MRINFKFTLALSWLSALILSAPVKADLDVFACEPEYAALAEQIGQQHVTVVSATTAQQDPHFVQARPSLIAKMRRADLLVCAGADLEIGWLPMLQMKSANRDLQGNGKGVLFAADVVENLDVITNIDRSMGDVHRLGNPHVHLDPQRLLEVAQALSLKMAELDSENRADYEANYQLFAQQWQNHIKRWRELAAPLRGRKVVAYHSSFRYLFAFLGIEQVADLEPKPGMPPSTSHLLSLVQRVNNERIPLVVHTAYQEAKAAHWLAEKTAIVALELPYTVGGNAESDNLVSLFDSHINLLLNALQK